MLKLPVRPYYSTYLESPCLNEKSHWFSYTWSAQTSVPPGWIMLCSLEVIYIWETKQPPSKNMGRANSGQAARLHLKDKDHSFKDSMNPFFLLQYSANYSLQTLIHTLVETGFTVSLVWTCLGIASTNMRDLWPVLFHTMSYICIQEESCLIAV